MNVPRLMDDPGMNVPRLKDDPGMQRAALDG